MDSKLACAFAFGAAAGVLASEMLRRAYVKRRERVRILVLNGKGMGTRGQTEESRQRFQSKAVFSDYDSFINNCFCELGVDGEHFQSNDLDAFIAKGRAWDGDAIVMNPAFFGTEPSLGSLVEDLLSRKIPVFEVHYSNYLRKLEPSFVSKHATGVVVGGKLGGYRKAIEMAVATRSPAWTKFDLSS
eukprot:TRINITY_DN25845_c0_g1_i1.p1 TRINITY_DN25845_c0_g1~~TRINITY_DN25845_c0_g1_i1.p1  ORF type:complete len:187 (+),score=23.40 TRINITY_DN25845_c0_g1_i1:61-621(+)